MSDLWNANFQLFKRKFKLLVLLETLDRSVGSLNALVNVLKLLFIKQNMKSDFIPKTHIKIVLNIKAFKTDTLTTKENSRQRRCWRKKYFTATFYYLL